MKTQRKVRFLSFVLTVVLVMLAIPSISRAAEATVYLGTTEKYAVLAGSTITNTGSTTIGGSVGGNIGVSPKSAITGFPPGAVSDGTLHWNDADAIQAKTDLTTAYNDAAGRTVTADLTDQDLGGLTLTTGVYFFSSSAQLTGTLTLDAQGDPEAVFIFQIGSTLTTASDSVVSLINGARFCRVFWQVGSSATLGTSTQFVGHIFAMASITANTSATVQGQLLASTGAVTLDSNTITNGICVAPTPTPTTAAAGAANASNPGAFAATAPTTAAAGAANASNPGAFAATALTTAVTGTTNVSTPAPVATSTQPPTATTENPELPKTGESGAALVVIGILLLALSIGLGLTLHPVTRKNKTHK